MRAVLGSKRSGSVGKDCAALAAGWLAALVLAAGAVGSAAAKEGVLVDNVPSGLDKAAVLEAVRDALKYRQWTLVPAEKADAVAANIQRSTVQARIVVWQQGDKLFFEESAEDGRRGFDFRGMPLAPQKIPTPSRWIGYLRNDITERLKALPAGAPGGAPPPSPAARNQERPAAGAHERTAAPGSAVQRMQELKELLDKGLISNEEYERKKAKILEDL